MVEDDDGDEAIGTVWKGNARGCFVRGDWSVALRRLFWSTYRALSACRFLPSPSHPTTTTTTWTNTTSSSSLIR